MAVISPYIQLSSYILKSLTNISFATWYLIYIYYSLTFINQLSSTS